eukprot:6172860-Pleurochrysis_carterae.AAC.1
MEGGSERGHEAWTGRLAGVLIRGKLDRLFAGKNLAWRPFVTDEKTECRNVDMELRSVAICRDPLRSAATRCGLLRYAALSLKGRGRRSPRPRSARW